MACQRTLMTWIIAHNIDLIDWPIRYYLQAAGIELKYCWVWLKAKHLQVCHIYSRVLSVLFPSPGNLCHEACEVFVKMGYSLFELILRNWIKSGNLLLHFLSLLKYGWILMYILQLEWFKWFKLTYVLFLPLTLVGIMYVSVRRLVDNALYHICNIYQVYITPWQALRNGTASLC